jgi:hypothetical protein
MFMVIVLNCVALALEGPHVVPGSTLDRALVWSNVVFTAIYVAEAGMKSFAYTFTAYIKRITNQASRVAAQPLLARRRACASAAACPAWQPGCSRDSV